MSWTKILKEVKEKYVIEKEKKQKLKYVEVVQANCWNEDLLLSFV